MCWRRCDPYSTLCQATRHLHLHLSMPPLHQANHACREVLRSRNEHLEQFVSSPVSFYAMELSLTSASCLYATTRLRPTRGAIARSQSCHSRRQYSNRVSLRRVRHPSLRLLTQTPSSYGRPTSASRQPASAVGGRASRLLLPARRMRGTTPNRRGTQTSIIKTARGVESASNGKETRGRREPRKKNSREMKTFLPVYS